MTRVLIVDDSPIDRALVGGLLEKQAGFQIITAEDGEQGLTLFQANGKASLQTVFHFHLHLLPRWENDGMSLAWPAKNPPRETLEEYRQRISARLV